MSRTRRKFEAAFKARVALEAVREEATVAALARFRVPEIFNTDQGAQFTSVAFTGRLEAADTAISMDGRGRRLDCRNGTRSVNVFVERLHRTLLDEHFRVEGRRTWFETIEEMQGGLDEYLVVYNRKRPHQGRGMNGRTPPPPGQAFQDGLPLKDKPATIAKEQKPKAA